MCNKNNSNHFEVIKQKSLQLSFILKLALNLINIQPIKTPFHIEFFALGMESTVLFIGNYSLCWSFGDVKGNSVQHHVYQKEAVT